MVMSAFTEKANAHDAKNRGPGRRGRKQIASHSGNSGKKYNNDSPIFQAFQTFQEELDRKHDRYERLVKLSRDITISSKRTIFLLQRVSGAEESEAKDMLEQAENQLHEIRQTKFLQIAQELTHEDPYQFVRAYSPGLQEYIEAVTLLHYLQTESLISFANVSKELVFKVEGSDDKQVAERAEHSALSKEKGTVSVFVSPLDYMLGVADLTGELMRIAISSIGGGDIDSPFKLCLFISVVHDAFLSFENCSRELSRKLSVLRQSLKKVETACYTICVRGSEIPSHMLADVLKSDPGPFPTDQGDMSAIID